MNVRRTVALLVLAHVAAYAVASAVTYAACTAYWNRRHPA